MLIVDDVSDHQERWLKDNVTRMRRPEDPFTYEAVVVPSLEDALIAVLFNHNIQAIVVRPGLVLKSKIDIRDPAQLSGPHRRQANRRCHRSPRITAPDCAA